MGGAEFRPPIAKDQAPTAPASAAASLPSFSFVGGSVLAGLLEGALAGQMGKPSIRLLKYQVDEALASYDAGNRPGLYQVGTLTFANHLTLARQVARLRTASTALAALLV